MTADRKQIIVIVRGSEECHCSVDAEGLGLGDIGGSDMGNWIACPHGSVARELRAEGIPADKAAEALGLTLERIEWAGRDCFNVAEELEELAKQPITRKSKLDHYRAAERRRCDGNAWGNVADLLRECEAGRRVREVQEKQT